MSYYDDWEYEEDGNHGNDRYDEYDVCSNHTEPDQYEYEDIPEEPEHEHEEPEYEGDERHELEELEYVGNEVYEDEEFEDGEDTIHDPPEHGGDDDEARELRELEIMVGKWGYKPQVHEYHSSNALGTKGAEYEHDDDDGARVFSPINYNVVEHLTPPSTILNTPHPMPNTPFTPIPPHA
jgi:hypothetical protein